MGNTKSGYKKQPLPLVNNELPPSYEECTTRFKIPTLTNQPIKLKDLKREEQEFAAEQKKAYEESYVKMCNSLIEHINDQLRNIHRNAQRTAIPITINTNITTRFIPKKYLSANLTKIYFQNYKQFICEMYKDFKIETYEHEHIRSVTFVFNIPK